MKRIAKYVVVAGAAILLFAAVTGVRINTTRSIPLGLYRVSDEPIAKGSYVIFCPPKREVLDEAKQRNYIGAGFCPGGYGYMMKRVLAVAGDSVVIGAPGVRVNGALLPHSAPLTSDKTGRPLPRFQAANYRLSPSELLLMSDVSATSYDGRYFGPVERAQIQSVIRPILTW